MENFIERSHLAVIRKMELTSNEAVKQAVMAGLGYSIMPRIGVENELQYGRLQIIPVTGLPIKNTWRLIWQKGKKHSPVAAAFLEYMRQRKSEIVKKYFSFEENY